MTSRNYLLDIDFLTHSPFVRWFFGHDYTATLKISILFCYHFPIWLFCDRFDEGCVCHVGYDFRSLKCIFILFVIFHVSLSFALAWLQNYENFPVSTTLISALQWDTTYNGVNFFTTSIFYFFFFLVLYYSKLCDMWYIVHYVINNFY